MSDAPNHPEIKVVDRRRFKDDGQPVSPEGSAPEGPERVERPPEDAAEKAARQHREARIDELTRAYAALVEDNKAFRARTEREKERVIAAERASVAEVLLGAADELERALAAMAAT